MSLRPITRRAFASGIAVAAGAALMRNLIQAEGTPEATPAEDESSQLLIRVETIGTMQEIAPPLAAEGVMKNDR